MCLIPLTLRCLNLTGEVLIAAQGKKKKKSEKFVLGVCTPLLLLLLLLRRNLHLPFKRVPCTNSAH